MNDLDVDVTGRIDGKWNGQQVRIIGSGASPLEFAYTLVYLLGLSGSLGFGVGTLAGAIALYVINLAWGWVLLLMLLVTAVTTAVSHLLLIFSLKLLITTYGSNHQPRDEGGRYVPIHQNGRLTGHLFVKSRRKIAKMWGRLRGGGVVTK